MRDLDVARRVHRGTERPHREWDGGRWRSAPRLDVRREDRDRCRDRGREVCVDRRDRDREADVRRWARAVGDPPPFGKPVFIVTHATREPLPMQGGTTYTFVTAGNEDALEVARAAAGD